MKLQARVSNDSYYHQGYERLVVRIWLSFAARGAYFAAVAAILSLELVGASGQTPAPNPTPTAASALKAVDLLPLNFLGQPLSSFVPVLGNRLSVAGLGQTQLTGTISIPGQPDASIVVVRQNPGIVRVDIGTGVSKATAVVNEQAATASATLSKTLQQVVESVLYDSPEYLLFDYANAGGARILGSALPYPRAPQSRFELIEKLENLSVSKIAGQRRKQFYFNRATNLLDYVRYIEGTDASGATVETSFTWQKSGTETLPATVRRWEGGVSVFTIQFVQATAGAKGPAAVFLP